MTVTAGFRTIESGDVVSGGEQVVLHAVADDGKVNILLPTEEIPRILAVLISLLGDARRERFKSGSVDMQAFELKRLEYEDRSHEGREILRAVIGQTRDAALLLSLPKGELAPIISGILESMGHVAPEPPGKPKH